MPSRPAFASGGFGLPPPRAIPVTMVLCGLLAVVSLVGAVVGRQTGVGLELLRFQVDAVLDLELWRFLTFPFVESTAFGFLIGLVVLWMFGGWFEATYGRHDYVRFFATSCLGAAVLAIPLSFVLSLIMPFSDVGAAEGPGPAINAMLVAMAYRMPDANVLFFVFPMRARTMILVVLGYEIIQGIYTGAADLSMTLAGMLMGYLLVTGMWRPQRLVDFVRLYLLRRRRRGFYVVPPKDHRLN
ncbi:MAG: rhomboid family intramembrane serine protease [Deltaproteobacteria bacterium]|nr:rhomboid family intramembrane serine protease [Deltaproteobacteria bacterium]